MPPRRPHPVGSLYHRPWRERAAAAQPFMGREIQITMRAKGGADPVVIRGTLLTVAVMWAHTTNDVAVLANPTVNRPAEEPLHPEHPLGVSLSNVHEIRCVIPPEEIAP